MKRAIFPGSFDPVTNGHIDLIKRASKICDELLVTVMINDSKAPFIPLEERVELLKKVTKNIDNIKVCFNRGLLADFVKKENIDMIIRGVRSAADFEYEFQMSQANKALSDGVDTYFLATAPEYSYISSSTVREIVVFGGDISQFVPKIVKDYIAETIRS